MPFLRRLLRRRRVHGDPHLAAGDARIGVGEAEQRAGVVGLEEHHLAAVAVGAQIAQQRRVAADPGIEAERADLPGASRQAQLDVAQDLAVVADQRAHLEIEVDVARGRFRVVTARTRHGGLHEAAAVIDLAAHRHLHGAVGRALGLHRGFVAVGKREAREIGEHDLALVVHLDRALHQRAGALDHDILEAKRAALVDEGEDGAGGLARRLDPAGKQVGDLGLHQIAVDDEAALALARSDAAVELDGNRAAQHGAQIGAEAGARRLVEGRLQPHFRVGLAHRFLIID